MITASLASQSPFWWAAWPFAAAKMAAVVVSWGTPSIKGGWPSSRRLVLLLLALHGGIHSARAGSPFASKAALITAVDEWNADPDTARNVRVLGRRGVVGWPGWVRTGRGRKAPPSPMHVDLCMYGHAKA